MRLYFKYISIIFKSKLQYKASLILSTIGQFLVSFTTFLGVFFMFDRFNSVSGFTFAEVLLTFSVVLASFSLAECLVRGFDAFSGIISNGEFDRIIIRPRNEILQTLASRIELERIGRLAQGIFMLIYAINTAKINWSIDKIITIVFMILGGFVVFSSLFIIYASFCFFTTEGLEFMNIFTDGAKEFGKYPFSIYGKEVLRFVTFVVPIALFQYYPLLYITEKSDSILYMFLPLVSMLFLIPSLLFWKFGIRHYKSTGS